MHEGEVIYNKVLETDLAWINRNVWRRATAIYKPGSSYGTTDIEVVVRDEKPLNFYLGADNTGFRVTEYERLFIGLNWGNFLDLSLNLQDLIENTP